MEKRVKFVPYLLAIVHFLLVCRIQYVVLTQVCIQLFMRLQDSSANLLTSFLPFNRKLRVPLVANVTFHLHRYHHRVNQNLCAPLAANITFYRPLLCQPKSSCPYCCKHQMFTELGASLFEIAQSLFALEGTCILVAMALNKKKS